MLVINHTKNILGLIVICIWVGCNHSPKRNIILVKNKHGVERISETVTIPIAELNMDGLSDSLQWVIKDMETGEYLPCQWVNQNGERTKKVLIFQVNIKPYSKKNYRLIGQKAKLYIDTLKRTYSRFVPERIDDYAWENDRVAFRTYGPEGERLVKVNEEGGILSSGIDCWLKRVSYPIIDKWYKKYSDGNGSYHIDEGEGLDSYEVNDSRGCGGTGILVNDSLYVSGNFISYKTLETGPVRTSFELYYAPWNAAGTIVHEKKVISLDLGSNLAHVEEIFKAPFPKNIVAGLAIDQNEGLVTINEKSGWCSYWNHHEDSELGVGIVADPKYVTGMTEYRVNKTGHSHLFVHLKPVNGKIVYYTGFGWKKSGQFESQQQWESYLTEFTTRLVFPLEVEIK